MSFERKRSSGKAYVSASKRKSKQINDDEEDEDYPTYGLRDKPKSPIKAKRGSEIMRILQD